MTFLNHQSKGFDVTESTMRLNPQIESNKELKFQLDDPHVPVSVKMKFDPSEDINVKMGFDYEDSKVIS